MPQPGKYAIKSCRRLLNYVEKSTSKSNYLNQRDQLQKNIMVDRSEYIIDHAIAEGMEVLLAEVIRKYPIIYDRGGKQKNGPSFQDKFDAAWNKISDELNLELDSCKSLWSCMKQKFIKHRKRLDNGEPVTAWPTYSVLHKWLDKHVKKRKSRHDYIKQMKLTQKPKSETNDDDDTNEHDEEWAELMEDKNTMVQVKLKRKADTPISNEKNNMSSTKLHCSSGNRHEPKKRFNIEVVSDSGTTVYNEQDLFDETERKATTIKDAEIVVLDECRAKQSTPQIEIIDVKESIKSNDTDESILKIERLLINFVHSLERLNIEHNAGDSNDAFGKYVASMVRELPASKRMKVRLNILQYATELIASETSPLNN